MKARDLRELSGDELTVRLRERQQELADIRLKHRSGTDTERGAQMVHLRREIARIKTITGERERQS